MNSKASQSVIKQQIVMVRARIISSNQIKVIFVEKIVKHLLQHRSWYHECNRKMLLKEVQQGALQISQMQTWLHLLNVLLLFNVRSDVVVPVSYVRITKIHKGQQGNKQQLQQILTLANWITAVTIKIWWAMKQMQSRIVIWE